MDTTKSSQIPSPPQGVESRASWDQVWGSGSLDIAALTDFTAVSADDWRAAVDGNLLEPMRDGAANAIGSRIRAAREGISSKRAEFCRLLQIHENTLAKMERGESLPDAVQLMQIAALTGRQVIWLLGGGLQEPSRNGDGSPPNSTEAVELDGVVYVPLFDVRASAGTGAFNDQERVLQMRPFAADYIRRDLHILHNQMALVTIVGNSMEPDIHSGDVGLIDRRDKDISVEGPHLVRIDGGLLLKMVQRLPGGVLRVSSKNQLSSPFDINVMDGTLNDFEVIGRLRWAGVRFN